VAGSSNADKDKQEIFKNINELLQDINVFIYSPTLEPGVDSQVAVNRVFGICSPSGNSQRAFLQMLARSRNVINNSLYLYIGNISLNACYNFWNFNEVAQVFKHDIKHTSMEVYGNFIKPGIKNVTLYENSLFNKVEELNKNSYIYLNYLNALAINKGYTFEVLDQDDDKSKTNKQNTTNLKIQNIMEADYISNVEYRELQQKQKQGQTTTSENHKITKHSYKKLLAIDCLDADELKPFVYNPDLLYNFKCLVDDSNMNVNDNFKTKQHKEKVHIIRNMLKQLGFDNIMDNKQIDKATLRGNFFNMGIDQQKVKVLFNLSKSYDIKEEITNKQLLGFINTIVKEFSMSIKPSKRHVREDGQVRTPYT